MFASAKAAAALVIEATADAVPDLVFAVFPVIASVLLSLLSFFTEDGFWNKYTACV